MESIIKTLNSKGSWLKNHKIVTEIIMNSKNPAAKTPKKNIKGSASKVITSNKNQ